VPADDSAPLFRKVDCVQLSVPDLNEALEFYQRRLGHDLVWRSGDSAGLRMPDTDTEIVLQTVHSGMEINMLVDSADAAANRFVESGGKVLVPPFDIQIGRCVVVEDPWGNTLVLLDMSVGPLVTDENGNVVSGL
jgi:predicted enzyme related to lactoylglutathione lyase